MRACVAIVSLLAGCGDAVLVVVDGDREVPTQIDAICLAVADRDPTGGHFGRLYRLEGELAGLPQSLAVEPGGASSAEAWVRGYRGGVEVARDRATVDFGGDVRLHVDRCPSAPGGAPAEVATAGPGNALLAPSNGRGGTLIAAVAGTVFVIDADGATLTARDTSLAADGILALDADGDCDDDLVVWSGVARLLRRDVADFTDTGAVNDFDVRAAAAADLDRDGDQDLVLGAGSTLRLYRAGTGGFTEDAGAIPSGGISDVTALAIGDVDGDGNPDILVGQGDATGAPPRAFVNDAAGTGSFTAAPAVLPEVDLRIRALALADLDGDDDLDLAVGLAGAPARLYINRGGLLEDQSFIRLPNTPDDVTAIAAADWNGDCAPDLALAAATGAQLLEGSENGDLVAESTAAGGAGAVLADVDDDGDPDLVLATAGGVTWLRR